MFWGKGARMLIGLFVLIVIVNMTSAQQPDSSDGSPLTPLKPPKNFYQQITDAQEHLQAQIVHTRPKTNPVLAGHFFGFYTDQAEDLNGQLRSHIEGKVFPASLAEQRKLAAKLEQFTVSVRDYARMSALHRGRLDVEQERLISAMWDFPETNEVFQGLQVLGDRAELYRALLEQHTREEQIRHDLKDLATLTSHRLNRGFEQAIHI